MFRYADVEFRYAEALQRYASVENRYAEVAFRYAALLRSVIAVEIRYAGVELSGVASVGERVLSRLPAQLTHSEQSDEVRRRAGR